jgi:hypothetical protein
MKPVLLTSCQVPYVEHEAHTPAHSLTAYQRGEFPVTHLHFLYGFLCGAYAKYSYYKKCHDKVRLQFLDVPFPHRQVKRF